MILAYDQNTYFWNILFNFNKLALFYSQVALCLNFYVKKEWPCSPQSLPIDAYQSHLLSTLSPAFTEAGLRHRKTSARRGPSRRQAQGNRKMGRNGDGVTWRI
jgi:hypothetical protein